VPSIVRCQHAVVRLDRFRDPAKSETCANATSHRSRARSCPAMLAVALSCVAWQARQSVPRRLLSGTSSDTAKVPIGYPGTADMPLRVVGVSTIHRMRPVDMASGSGMLEGMLGRPLADVTPFVQSRLGVVCCYAFPHVPLVLFLVVCSKIASQMAAASHAGGLNIAAAVDFLVCAAVINAVLVYAAVINAVGEYIANLDLFKSQAAGGVSNAVASTFGALCSRATAFFLVVVAPISCFAPSQFGVFLSAGCVYLSFTIGVGRYLSSVFFPI
jgi:hypothetical protein